MKSFASAHADRVVRNPWIVLGLIVGVSVVATWATTKLTINPNQLDLISQDLQEVKDVKRVVDMIGGSGFLVFAMRSSETDLMKKVADDLAEQIRADTENVRTLTYRQPVEFIQQNMVLFAKTEDLIEVKKRVNAVIRDRLRRNNPFAFELRPTEPKKLVLDDIVKKYGSVGKKSILDDYYVSDDKEMLLLLIKPTWEANQLPRTQALIDKLNALLADYSRDNPHGATLVEDYELVGSGGRIAYGYTGSYKTTLDDSAAIMASLEPVSAVAFIGIFVVVALFFRRLAPSILTVVGTALGTIITMGFSYATIGQLNMVTSCMGGILLGFGVDYGIHFTYRTRIELGAGRTYDDAVRNALINAGRPALVAAVVTAGSFMVLIVSEFRGFSQFGFLAGIGTLIIALTVFHFCAVSVILLGRVNPAWPARLIGTMKPPSEALESGEVRIRRPGLVLLVSSVVVGLLCVFALPWRPGDAPPEGAGWVDRLGFGARFNYNSRALMPENQPSLRLQDEINRRFQISSDPTAIYTRNLEETKEVFDELTTHPDKYTTIDQVVSLYSFIPPPETAAANAAILAEWKSEQLDQLDMDLFPEELQKHRPLVEKALQAKPYGVEGVPEVFAKQFQHLPQSLPENHGYLTFVYPRVDLWDGRQLLAFADETAVITTASGHTFRSAGSAVLYARLARIVLFDGKLTVLLTAIWILAMHYLDFRSVRLALASVIPLGLGMLMMLGIMALVDHRLNFMNIIMLPILLGFGVSHGLYLLHRFLEGTAPLVALRSVGAAVASSTLTTVVGFASLFVASHHGLRSMGFVACLGLVTILVVSFTVLAAVLQLLHDARAAPQEAEAKIEPAA